MPTAHDSDDVHYETGLIRNSNENHKDNNKDKDLTDEQNKPLRRSNRVRKEPQRFVSPLPLALLKNEPNNSRKERLEKGEVM